MQKTMVLGIAVILVLTGSVVRAEEQTSLLLTDVQIAEIKTNCLSVQSTLERIHASDALARVNLGQQYETISTKLMAPMNSRIALNRLDGIELTKTTVEFNNELDRFRSMYQQYEQTILRATKINCSNQPVSFYDTVSLAREHRAEVRQSVDKMTVLTKQYGEQFDTFRAKTLEKTERAS